MRRSRRIAISIAVGLAAAVISVAYAGSVKAKTQDALEHATERYGGEMVEVCVAARDIDPGEVLDEANVLVESWVSGLLPREAATSVREVAGKTVASRIPKGAVVCGAYLEAAKDGVEVPRGMVAVSVSSDESHAVGGSVSNGDKVDVYVSKDGIADRLCSGRVLATSSQADGAGQLEWVTLAVGPGAVSELLAATSRGQVTLVIPGETSKAAGADEKER